MNHTVQFDKGLLPLQRFGSAVTTFFVGLQLNAAACCSSAFIAEKLVRVGFYVLQQRVAMRTHFVACVVDCCSSDKFVYYTTYRQL
jgi:hypothetical protein